MSEPEIGEVVRKIVLVVEDEFFIAIELESVLTRGDLRFWVRRAPSIRRLNC